MALLHVWIECCVIPPSLLFSLCCVCSIGLGRGVNVRVELAEANPVFRCAGVCAFFESVQSKPHRLLLVLACDGQSYRAQNGEEVADPTRRRATVPPRRSGLSAWTEKTARGTGGRHRTGRIGSFSPKSRHFSLSPSIFPPIFLRTSSWPSFTWCGV